MNTQTPLHTEAFTHRGFHTRSFYFYTQRSLYTEQLLQTKASSQNSAYTHTLLHTAIFYTVKLLHTETVAQKKLLHRKAFTHRSFYTQRLSHTGKFYIEKLLRREALPQSSFVTLQNHNCCRLALISRECVAPEISSLTILRYLILALGLHFLRRGCI